MKKTLLVLALTTVTGIFAMDVTELDAPTSPQMKRSRYSMPNVSRRDAKIFGAGVTTGVAATGVLGGIWAYTMPKYRAMKKQLIDSKKQEAALKEKLRNADSRKEKVELKKQLNKVEQDIKETNKNIKSIPRRVRARK